MLRDYFCSIGRFARWSLAYTIFLLLAACLHRLILWTPFYTVFGAPIVFGLLGLASLTLTMFAYAFLAAFEVGFAFAVKILICAILMLGAILLIGTIDAPTIIYAT